MPIDPAKRAGALEDIRVVEFAQALAVPYCGQIMADMGADVVKVEPPDGDVTRLWGRISAGLSTYYTQQNCGKRNIGIDLTEPNLGDNRFYTGLFTDDIEDIL